MIDEALKALEFKDFKTVHRNTDLCLMESEEKAKSIQKYLLDNPEKSDPRLNYPLNDTAVCLYYKGEAYRMAGEFEKALEMYKRVVQDFSYAEVWDSHSWKPAVMAKRRAEEIQYCK